ncbi:MAG: sulfatase-like hydrolase/transferase [Chloroflexota bacterium]
MEMSNILFILTDQWPAWAFSFCGADIPTPNIDRLAAEGTVFTNAFTTCPLCTPARGTLLTARWPHQTGVLDNYAVGYSQQISMPLTEQTWIDEAVRQGYHVGYFGKWHLGPISPEVRGAHRFDPDVEINRHPFDPKTSDFSYQLAMERYEQQGNEMLTQGRSPFWGEIAMAKEEKQPFPVMNSGVQFLEEWASRKRDNPFFLTVSSAPPHFPHFLPSEYARIAEQLRPSVELPASLNDDCEGRPTFHAMPWWPCMDTSVLDEEEWRTVIAYSHAHIMLVDEAIGRVLDTLEWLGLSESTTVVFTSDHGDMEGAHNRFDKGAYFYEEVWRIPLIIRSPNALSATQDAFVSLIDIGETLFGLIGAESTAELPHAGRDLMPLVGKFTRPHDWSQIAYGVYNLYNGMSFAVRAIRSERYKYVWNPQERDELYDLASDRYELENLRGQVAYEAIEAELRHKLMAWLTEIGDNLPERVPELPLAGTIMATAEMGP